AQSTSLPLPSQSLTVAADTTDQQQPLYLLFHLYCSVMDGIHSHQILMSVQQDLCGLKQCALKVPNEDRVPSHRIDDYYAWMTWKKFTLSLADRTWTNRRFKEVAMKNYIATAQKYLTRLNLLRM